MGRWLLIIISVLVCIPSLQVKAEENAEDPFAVSAEAGVLIEVESGRVLWEKDADSEKRIASITKIMTAMIAIEHGDLDDSVEISANAVRTEGSSLYLQEGEKATLEDLLYGLMLRSGNDSAIAIAEHVGGSVDGFVYLMNEKANELGLESTVFANPHGLDDHEDHYSSAYDMAMIMQAAMQRDEFRDISGTEIHRAPNENEDWERVWRNKNRLLTERYEYTTGGKTGYTDRARRTLVTSAEKDGMELIAVTLNAPSDWDDHVRMFEYGFDTFRMQMLIRQGGLERSANEQYEDFEVRRSVTYPLTESEYRRVLPRIKWSSEEEGPFAGNIQFQLDGDVISEQPIYREGEDENEELSWWQRFTNSLRQIMG
ncbi:D-alanyl-D-alanine carboxypeptidase family protein [Natribacillus halophilus]|uniref:D-alanyl-D-alanine carboxypeptidase n=1 Tax=Natribacillus halophilus TaxID=549003 RepID=A0A1G8JFB2_9BACI|nr:D-alanyl-D-alanine carboxypeptidase family protein [Natribacillus halophilus]SDI29928.1 D-alanyl-D-alanine carboxypeptidase [Natribacillus halophilus]